MGLRGQWASLQVRHFSEAAPGAAAIDLWPQEFQFA